MLPSTVEPATYRYYTETVESSKVLALNMKRSKLEMCRHLFDVNYCAVVALAIIITFLLIETSCEVNEEEEAKPSWKKKNIRDYNDADMERLYDQWEEGDEPLEEDELPEYLRKSPKLDFADMDMSNPESFLKLSKKGKTLMSFVSVSGNPTRDELEELTKIWQSSLMNNHIQADRFVVDERRAIFMFKDGSQAWEAKDFLVEQERCEEVVIENKNYPGKYANKKESQKSEMKKEKPERSKSNEEL